MSRRATWTLGSVLVLIVAAAACHRRATESAEPSAPPATPTRLADQPKADPAAAAFAAPIEKAHNLAVWRAQAAVQTDIVVRWGERTLLDGRMTFPTDLSRSRLRLADGTIAVFDGEHAWVSPAESRLKGARFHLLTWPYFLAAPMKLRDPGTHLEPLGDRPMRQGAAFPAARLTFAPGIGDTPDDWYVAYRDPATDRLAALAYIVTFGTPIEEAEKEPHLIIYADFKDVAGVPMATTWTFYHWNAGEGAYGDPIGEVKLSGIRFLTPAADAFLQPTGSREDALPARE
jgi:hypothetical protein